MYHDVWWVNTTMTLINVFTSCTWLCNDCAIWNYLTMFQGRTFPLLAFVMFGNSMVSQLVCSMTRSKVNFMKQAFCGTCSVTLGKRAHSNNEIVKCFKAHNFVKMKCKLDRSVLDYYLHNVDVCVPPPPEKLEYQIIQAIDTTHKCAVIFCI